MDTDSVLQFVEQFWEDDVMDSLSRYVEIPNKSPMFDPDWEANGFMREAVDHLVDWVNAQEVPDLSVEVHDLPGRTPTILLEYPGEIDDTILIYGHLDKQPEFDGWFDGLGPWKAVRKDDKLYGRGGADDGYAIYSAIAIIKAMLRERLRENVRMPRIVVIIEASEESGSPDLPHYMELLSDRIGQASLVLALDSTCGNYDQLWITTSLRGMLIGELSVKVLEQGAHSGASGGIVASSFRITRQLLSRLEDESTGEIIPSFLNEQIPDTRRNEAMAAGEVLSKDFKTMYTFAGNSGPMSDDPTELVLNNTWLATMEVTGIDGVPATKDAGNVLRPYTTTKFALRLPPTTNAEHAAEALKKLMVENAPDDVVVSLDFEQPNAGWHAPETDPVLDDALQAASQAYFGKRAVSMGCGGSIPFMQFLADSMPGAQFVVTGVLGPHSNAHGPNEFLHIPTVKKLTACMASVIHDWSRRPAANR